jgi:lipopolysaccharide transport system permease protein
MTFPTSTKSTEDSSDIKMILPAHSLVIEKTTGWSSLGLRDIWEYRELLTFLVWREIQGAYRQTALGMSWIFLRPVLNMIVLSVVFGQIVKVPSDGVPYPLFSLAALLPWGFFSNAVIRGSRSLVDNMHLISKVYFPRMVIPIAGSVSGLVDFGASFLVLLAALLLYRMPLRPEIVWLPVFLLLSLAFALAVGFWLATLSVKYRDVSFAVTFLLQALMYASPVIYSTTLITGPLRYLYYLNPMTGVIQGFRWAILGSEEPPGSLFLLSIGIVLVGLISGAYVFRRTERTVVDIL